jgi:hypothetical protein
VWETALITRLEKPTIPTSREKPPGAGPDGASQATGARYMLETIAILLVILWALGLVTSYTMGGLVHLLLVFAIIVVLIRVIQGRRI